MVHPTFSALTRQALEYCIELRAPQHKKDVDILDQSKISRRSAGWLRGWSTGCMKIGWETWGCSTCRREDEGILVLSTIKHVKTVPFYYKSQHLALRKTFSNGVKNICHYTRDYRKDFFYQLKPNLEKSSPKQVSPSLRSEQNTKLRGTSLRYL